MQTTVNSSRESAPSQRRAIVIGGSIAGLVAARVLADHVDQVVLIERDRYPDTPIGRKGAPQARHVHQVLLQGKKILEQLFPGLNAELLSHGALEADFVAETTWFNPVFGRGPRFDSGLLVTMCSRDLLEWVIHRRVAAHPKISIIDHHDVVGLCLTADQQRVNGVQIRSRGEDATLSSQSADLVVDASGRDTHASEWLQAHGYPAPPVTVANAFVGYSSRYYERTDDPQRDWKLLWILTMPPTIPRAAIVLPIEGDRWLVTLVGAARDYPPNDEEGFVAFAKSLADPSVYQLVSNARPLSPISSYRRTEGRLRHYEQLERRPEGFVALGDAVCGFNPFYGQGITMAAASAVLLGECLGQHRSNGAGPYDGFAKKFQKRLAKLNRLPWLLATGIDSLYPTTEGIQRGLLTRLLHWYMNPMLVISSYNPAVYTRFLKVMHLLESPLTLLHPQVISAVIRHAFGGQTSRKLVLPPNADSTL
jgi:2-polyprenyl-6-methoxyphenol hydroxylase-like FAD-dependent oxidoreductase